MIWGRSADCNLHSFVSPIEMVLVAKDRGLNNLLIWEIGD